MWTRRELAVTVMTPLAAAARPNRVSDRWWRLAEPIYQKTLAHPFLLGLADGSLPGEKFRYYMIQDALYLAQYARALNVLASKSPREDWGLFFSRGAMECIQTERQLHESYVDPKELARTEAAPTNLAYTNHLLATVHGGSFAEGLAAVTPCYWIYAEVARHLKRNGSRSPDYQRWIDQYAGEDFSSAVRTVLRIADSGLSGETARCEALFLRSVRYEYLFWDMAWRLERWPL